MFLQLGYIACKSDWTHVEFIWTDDSLSSEEIKDITVSWKEIEDGKAKRFTTVKELLEDLNEPNKGGENVD